MMTNDNRNSNSGDDKHRNSRDDGDRPGLVDRLKRLYEDRPMVFAVGVIGVSALMFLLGGVVSGDLMAPL